MYADSSSTSSSEVDDNADRTQSLSNLLDAFRYSRTVPNDPSDTWGGGIVLIGAGCSASAGIPLTLGVVDIALRRMALMNCLKTQQPLEGMEGKAIYELLRAGDYLTSVKSEYGPKLYGEIFEKIFPDPTQERLIIREAINKGGDKINWAHLRLGQLVAHKYIHTVLTTNFDQLALTALVKNGIFPAVADGLEALDRVDPRPSTPQLLHIHGSLHNYRRINSFGQIKRLGLSPKLNVSISSLLKDSPFLLIVGYRGEEDGLMVPLEEALKSFDGKPVYWTFHGREASAAARNLEKKHNATLLYGQDADQLFDSLAKGLNLGLPDWMANPVDKLTRDFDRIIPPKELKEVIILFGKHKKNLAVLKNLEEKDISYGQYDSAERDFAAALLRGDLKAARMALSTELLVAEKWADLASAAADAIVERDQQSAAIFLREAVEKLEGAPPQQIKTTKLLRIAEALLEIDEIDIANKILAASETGLCSEEEKSRWTRLTHRLGSRFIEAGKSAKGKASLLHAVSCYREALANGGRDDAPLEWAEIQYGLGNALTTLGLLEAGPARLEEAVTAYRAALEERTRERVPLEWAATQNNLGNALTRLGLLLSNTALLEEAVSTLRTSLEEHTRDRVPLNWAATQNNLGNALKSLGEQEDGTARLQEAVSAYRAALEERTRERVPLEWAGTQHNLGSALRNLGEREGSAARLKEAISVFRVGLEEHSRERALVRWTYAQHSLSNCLAALASHSAKPAAHLAEAITHMQNAVDGYREVGDEYWGPIAEKRLAELKARQK